MRTKVTMVSPDRKLFGTVIRHNTDGFLNLSDLQKSYNLQAEKENWPVRRVESILYAEDNWPRIYYALKEGKFINTSLLVFINNCKTIGITKTLKKEGVYKTLGARADKSTWCNPILFVLISLEMNPMIYGKVIYWLTDKLIINRIEAGNLYKELTSSIQKFQPNGEQYVLLAKTLNHVVFNRHEVGIRNTGTKEQLKRLYSIEEKMAFAIDMGYIETFDQLVREIRKMK